MPNPIKIQLSKDGGTTWLPIGDAIAGDDAFEMVGGSATVKARLDSAAWTTVTWDITATSDGDAAPTLTTNADRSCSFTVSLDEPIAFLLRARVNGGSTAETVASTVVKVKTGAGFELVAAGEENQANSAYGWLAAFNAIARSGGGGGGSFTGITLDDPVASFSSTAKFVGYDGVYFTTSGTEIGWHLNGTLVPSAWTSIVNSAGWSLFIAPAAGTGKRIRLFAQPSTDGDGGSIELFSGDGATSNGSVKWGRQSPYGDSWESGRLTTAGIEFCREESPETSSTIGGGATSDMTFRRLQASVTKGMVFELVSDTPDGDHAFEAFYRFSYGTNSSLRIPLIIGYESVRVSGDIVQAQPEAFSPSELDVTSECAPSVTTSSTTATLLTSRGINTNETISVTVDCLHDNGTATGRTVYTAVFRRGAGSATTETAAVDITPSSAMKKSHAVTIALNGNTIEVKVVAATSTSTKHRAQVAWVVGSIA